MDKKTLKQYRALQKEIPKIEKKLDKLYDKRLDIPVVLGKVTGSTKNHPYTPTRITVQIDDPKESDVLARQIKANEHRLSNTEKDKAEIEEFIASITDSTDRQIFEFTYIDGLRQEDVGSAVGFSRGRVSQIISGYLKD